MKKYNHHNRYNDNYVDELENKGIFVFKKFNSNI